MPISFPSGLVRPLQAGLAAAVLTSLVTLFLPNHYQSEARILPADTRGTGGLGQLAAAAAAVGVAVPGQESVDSAYVDILKSRWILEGLLGTPFQFRARSWRFGAEAPRQETLLQYLGARNVDRGLQQLKKRISVSRDLKTKLITIRVETTSPELSQQVCQRLVRQLDEFVVQRSKTRGSNKATFATSRLQEAREEMAQAEDAFRIFLNGNRNYQVSADPSVRLKGTRLEGELKLHAQIVATLAIAREQALLEEKNDMPILNVLDAGNLPIEKSWPPRTLFLLASFVLAALVCGLWQHRVWLARHLMESDDAPGPGRKSA